MNIIVEAGILHRFLMCPRCSCLACHYESCTSPHALAPSIKVAATDCPLNKPPAATTCTWSPAMGLFSPLTMAATAGMRTVEGHRRYARPPPLLHLERRSNLHLHLKISVRASGVQSYSWIRHLLGGAVRRHVSEGHRWHRRRAWFRSRSLW